MRRKLSILLISVIVAAAASGTVWAQNGSRPMAPANLIINPLGFIQFGPMIDLEFQLTPGLYGILHTRMAGLGLLTHLLEMASSSDLNEDVRFYAFAVGTGLRYFFQSPGTPNAPYIGFLAEYGYNPYFDDTGDIYAYTGTSTYVTFAVNGGYRWRFDSFLLQVGAYAGAAPTLTSTWKYTSNPGDTATHQGNLPTTFFGMVEVSIGFEL